MNTKKIRKHFNLTKKEVKKCSHITIKHLTTNYIDLHTKTKTFYSLESKAIEISTKKIKSSRKVRKIIYLMFKKDHIEIPF